MIILGVFLVQNVSKLSVPFGSVVGILPILSDMQNHTPQSFLIPFTAPPILDQAQPFFIQAIYFDLDR